MGSHLTRYTMPARAVPSPPIHRRTFIKGLATTAMFASLPRTLRDEAAAPASRPPNIIFILADDIALGDVGCYGQKLIATPNLDRMAAQGMRCTQAYCGSSVSAPSRASLITGLHTGHCPIRGNHEMQPEGQQPLPPDTVTVASILKSAGYATACAGKWGMGMFDTPGSPLKVGFDHFYGYNCQRHAHSYFPAYLYNDDKHFKLDGKTYAPDLIQKDSLQWIRAHADQPFFFFYATTLPHSKYEIDDLGQYADKDWTPREKAYAAMVTRLDTQVGELLDLLVELKVDDNTLVIFAGDNGSAFPPYSAIAQRFEEPHGMRGYKRGMYEGGLKQAAIIRWPGTVPAGKVCDNPWAFWDFLPTAAELAHAGIPVGFKTDGLSMVPMLRGGPGPKHESFYWELHERGFRQAVRFGDWKAVRNKPDDAIELYDLKQDPGEQTNLAAANPQIIARAEQLLTGMRVDDPNWPVQPLK